MQSSSAAVRPAPVARAESADPNETRPFSECFQAGGTVDRVVKGALVYGGPAALASVFGGLGGAAGAAADATVACILNPRDRFRSTAAAAVVGGLSGLAGACLGWKAAVVASAIGVLGFLSDSLPSPDAAEKP
ncbi:MAG: hypothetical protein HY319_24905 [Armatimonadetes bacterium]|nr:hypothetical protein [Armatimonadota bacterium]